MASRDIPDRDGTLIQALFAAAWSVAAYRFGVAASQLPAALAWSLCLLLVLDRKWANGLALAIGADRHLLRWSCALAIAVPALVIELGSPDGYRILVFATSASLVGLLLGRLFERLCSRGEESSTELLRLGLLAAAATLATLPYWRDALVGSGDARFYALQLADALMQTHEGKWQLFIGQSNFAIAGDFHPLRTAPYFQHLGAWIDFASGGLLSPVGVTNLTIVVSALGGALTCYLALLRLACRRRWLCCLLALLYVTSPGIVALVYGGDMIASWMTLPYLPLAIYGFVVLAQGGITVRRSLLVSIVMAGLWWCHAPIAFWVSLIGLCFVALALLRHGAWRRCRTWLALAAGGLVFACLAGYVFVSVAQLDLPPAEAQVKAMRDGSILTALVQSAQGVLRPVSGSGGDLLHDLQLSPGLWACLLMALWSLGSLSRAGRMLVATSAVLLLLLVPESHTIGRLWSLLPARLLAASDQWPMQRFYPILSAMAAFAGLLALRKRRARGADALIHGLLACACLWSVLELRKFDRRGFTVSWPRTLSHQTLLPENAGVSLYSRGYANADSPLDSNGPADVRLNLREFDPTNVCLEQSNLAFAESLFARRPLQSRPFRVDGDTAVLEGTLPVYPGYRTLLRFSFSGPLPEGTLVLKGRRIYQEYPLPSSGGWRAFGAAAGNSRILSLWVTGHQPDAVTVTFVARPGSLGGDFASVSAITVKNSALPIDVRSVTPILRVNSAYTDGWLDTPRIYVPGYEATVNGHPTEVSRSSEGHVLVRVPGGHHTVVLFFRGSLLLRMSYWLALAAWVAVFSALAARLSRRRLLGGLVHIPSPAPRGTAPIPATA